MVQAWARRGVECPFTTPGKGDFILVPPSEAAVAHRIAYDATMEHHVREAFGPNVFQLVREESYHTGATAP